MEFVRKSALVIIAPILVLLLFNLASTTSVTMVATKPEKVKKIIADSGVYETSIPNLLAEAQQVSSGSEEVPLTNVLVKTAAEKVFNPQFVRQNTEGVLDSIYLWLEGETPLPAFQVDLTSAKTDFAAGVAEAVRQKLAALPACPPGTPIPSDFDPFTATCRPAGMDPTAEAAAIEQSILTGGGFLDRPVITADTIKNEKDQQSVFSGPLKELPNVYQKVKVAPYALAALAILLSLAMVLLSTSKRKGLRRVGIIFLIVGVIILALAWAANRGLAEALQQMKLDNQVLDEKAKILITNFVAEMDKYYWIFGGGYTAIGVLAILGSHYSLRKEPEDEDLEGEGQTPEDRIELHEPDKPTEFERPRGEAALDDEPAVKKETPAKKPAAKPKPKPPAKKSSTKIKVQ